MISQAQSDVEELGASSVCMSMDDQLDIVKQIEIESKEETPSTEDIFANDIMLTHASRTSIKERRESKEKSKKELEEEEREKMQ